MDTEKIFCPDIGDFEEVDVIEILVKEGENVDIETPLITLESDKATMDVPSDKAGTISTIDVAIGDKVSKGTQLFSITNGKAQVIENTAEKQIDIQIERDRSSSEVVPIKVPDIGDFEEVDVIEILVKEGETVGIETPLITLESDKATMDIPSPFAGKIDRVLVKIGDKVSKNDTVAMIYVSDANQNKQGPLNPSIQNNPESLEEVIKDPDINAQANDVRQNLEPIQLTTPPEKIEQALICKSLNKKICQELGVDITRVNGSGPKNRILKEDIQAFVKIQIQTKPAEVKLKLVSRDDLQKHGDWEEEPSQKYKSVQAKTYTPAGINVPHVFQMDEIDVTELEKFRKERASDLKAENTKLTLLAFIIKATTTALQEFPRFNSSLIDDGNKIAVKNYYNIGFATNTENGLVVPVLKDTDKKGVVQIAREITELANLARKKQLKIQQMEGGCFTVSNLGGISGSFFTPIINPRSSNLRCIANKN